MSLYNFDTIIDRKGTNSLKYDFAKEFGKPETVLPLWVADMDFQIPPEAKDALVKYTQHSIYGYSDVKEDYFRAVHKWFVEQHSYDTKPEWLVKTPGVVFAIATAIRAFTQKGDAVMIQKPVYHPFENTITVNQRVCIDNSLVYKNGRYEIDFEDFERKIVDNKVKLFILCSPHNPVGRVWSKDELDNIGHICLKHDCMIVSDEIHCDIVYDGYTHHVFSNICPDFDNVIVCTSPSKTFNLAGLQVSNIFIANSQIRNAFKAEIRKTGYSQLNTMGLIACQSVYEHGQNWLAQLNQYLMGNIAYMKEFLSEKLPKIKMVEPEGTYLIWLDCSALNLSQDQLDDRIVNNAQLWLCSGTIFGTQGEGFQRVNIACPRQTLESAMERLEKNL